MEVSTLIGMGIAVVKKLNKRLFGDPVVLKSEEPEEETVDEVPSQPSGPFSFKSFILVSDYSHGVIYIGTEIKSKHIPGSIRLRLQRKNKSLCS